MTFGSSCIDTLGGDPSISISVKGEISEDPLSSCIGGTVSPEVDTWDFGSSDVRGIASSTIRGRDSLASDAGD